MTETTVADYQRGMAAAAERVSDVLAAAGPTTGVGPHRLERAIADIDLHEPLHDPAAALDELEHVYLRDAVYFHHPRYFGHLNCPVVIPAVLAEATLSAINSSMDTWDQSAGATLIEQRLIEWTARRIGLVRPPTAYSPAVGRSRICRRCCWPARRRGAVRRSEITPRLRILTSECGHFSVVKAAKLLGLDADAVIRVPCDERYRLRPDALAAQLRRCAEERLIPMAVVATAGTTDFGSIDPLPQIADLCARAKTWLHVDAAYGCGLLVSARHRELLAGIERADSVTVDFHKSFFQPVSSSAVLVRDRATLRHATYHADYLNPADDDSAPNLVDKSLQTTRRFDALKLWLTLRVMGARKSAAFSTICWSWPGRHSRSSTAIRGSRWRLLQAAGFTILRERAAIGYRHEQYEAIRPAGRKMLAALWRESPIGLLDSGERLAAMASLLHIDRVGESLAAALIRRSGSIRPNGCGDIWTRISYRSCTASMPTTWCSCRTERT